MTLPPVAGCAELIPQSWRLGVPGAPLPTTRDAGGWVAFGDAQTGQLDKANGRTIDSIGIVEKCEARERAAYERITGRSLWQKLTPWRE